MNNRPEIIAHRGASWDAPENTRSSIRLAWQENADAAEIDIQLTKDGAIVAIHDDNTERTTGARHAISQSTLADLKRLDAGSWKSPAYAGETIPTLEEILALIPAGKRLYIEIKDGAHIIPPLRIALQNINPKSLSLICFDQDVLSKAKQALPDIEALFLAQHRANKKSGHGPLTTGALIDLCRRSGFQGVDLDSYWPLDKREMEKLRTAGLKCCIWTVNRATPGRRLAAAGVDGLTTDRPQWLRQELARRGNPLAAPLEAFWSRMASRMP
jgi:glycerophosphoryl diester phosphodiesterase